MSMNSDGTATCDRCGGLCGNGGVLDALQLSDVSFDDGSMRQYHLCRVTGRLGNDGIRCCDTALNNITVATSYSHSPAPKDPPLVDFGKAPSTA